MFIFDTQTVKLVIDVSIEQNITLKPLLVFESYTYMWSNTKLGNRSMLRMLW